MPPQLSEEEDSGSEDVAIPIQIKDEPKRKGKSSVKDEPIKDEPEESLMVESEKEEEDDDEDLEPDEYVVEKITNHLVDEHTGELKFEVKWEGYEKKSERTWEPEESLLETASKILNEYLASVGGKEAILSAYEEKKAAIEAGKKGKKRGRISTGPPQNGGKKSRKNGAHPAEGTPPASSKKEFVPPSGTWEDLVESIEACEGEDEKVVVYLTWKAGAKTQHPLAQVYKRCPQKMLKFYEQHLVFKKNTDA